MIGQLTADPEVKQTTGGDLVRLGLATNYSWKDAAGEWKSGVDFHTVVAWRALAEKIAATFHKGDRIYIEGKLTTRSWQTEAGDKRYRTEVVALTAAGMSAESSSDQVGEKSLTDDIQLEEVIEVTA